MTTGKNNKKFEIDYIKDNYLEYAVAVLKDRAIPYLSDGLKPVQRRILYSMLKLKNTSTEKHKKSARIVGDVLGKYHPHGDSSVYDAMVRLSQWYNVRYPLVDGQGNLGSPDGDNAAAMRYTEVRMTKFSEEMLLKELSEEIVPYRDNYDGSDTEPTFLPARHNLSLLNGATGIAVALSTDVPSHNIVELNEATKMYIDDNDVDIRTMMKVIRGPDYPKGGQITESDDHLVKIYDSGRGVVRVRARWKIEKMSKGDWNIVVYELPPNVKTIDVLSRVDAIMNPKTKSDGKISPKDAAEKALLISVMGGCKDYSDKNTPISIILEPKSKKQDPEEFMNFLIPRLGLEEKVRINFTMVGIDGTPKGRNFKQIIADWVGNRFSIMTTRTKARINVIEKRTEILNGRMLALARIEEVIQIIQRSDDPKAELMEKINVSERQAEDILDIRLRQLARLEGIKIQKEIDALEKEKKGLNSLLDNDKKMYTLMKKELDEVTEMFADERRTLIKEEELIIKNSSDSIIDEDITVIFTKQGWITSRKGHDFDVNGIQLKIDDEVLFTGKGSTVNNCCFLGSDGRAYSVKGSDIPDGKVNWVHLNTLIQTEGRVDMNCMLFPDNSVDLLFYNNDGFGYISNSQNLYSKNKAGKNFMTLPSKESIVEKPIILGHSKYINIQTTDNRVLVYELSEINKLDRGKGVQLVKLADGQKIKSITLSEDEYFKILDWKGKFIVIKGDKYTPYLSKRARRGKVIDDKSNLTD